MSVTYYDILGVSPQSTSAEIRKAYLKASLKHHPDKNPGHEQEAQAKFVEIGRAYEILSDDSLRREYDLTLKNGSYSAGTNSGFASGFNTTSSSSTSGAGGFHSSSTSHTYAASEKEFENYRDFFDATVAGMSEEDLAAAVGTAAMIGNLVGSVLGSRFGSHGNRGGHGSRTASGGADAGAASGVLAALGGVIGSKVASELATSSVKALHKSSVQRVEYKQQCKLAAERGQPMPEAPAQSPLDAILRQTVDTIKKALQQPDQAAADFGNIWNMVASGLGCGGKTAGAAGQTAF